MHWTYLIAIVYVAIVALVCLRMLYETRSTTKTMAYLLLTIFVPVAGAVFYLLFGINYWKRKLYDKKFVEDKKMLDKLKKDMTVYTTESIDPGDISTGNMELATMLARELSSPLTRRNQVKLLINGDEKFPEVLEALRDARHHISTLNITFTSRVK